MFLTYVALLHKPKQAKSYSVMFPDFPGCAFSGKTIDESINKARQGLLFHMEGMLIEGEKLPDPSPLESVLAHYKEDGYLTSCLVHLVPPTGHIKRVNICIDAGLLVEIDHAAKMLGKNRSEFLAFAAQQMLS